MAHGGTADWNVSVERIAAAVSERAPTVVAFGMADRGRLETALDSLRSLGVRDVSVVRLFISGSSFRLRTRYLLGLTDSLPPRMAVDGEGMPPPDPIRHGLRVATHSDGLMDSDEVMSILADRALGVSSATEGERVLLLAHGMAREEDNDEVLARMAGVESRLRRAGFAAVRSSTLREDWPDARARAEAEVRGFVEDGAGAGRVIVVPFRLSGFGPYDSVLSGLDYVPTEGLIPDARIGAWVVERAAAIACGRGWEHPLGPCGDAVTSSRTSDPGSSAPARRAP
jgi:hypothetical protein